MSDIDTMNHYFVGSTGDRLRIMNLPGLAQGLEKDKALNLAAYLVSMSGATREEFEAVLDAIENT